MKKNRKTAAAGVLVRSVLRGSAFYRGGIRAGDRILSINGNAIADELDFQFYSAENVLELQVQRGERYGEFSILRDYGVPAGVTLAEAPVRRCSNRCVFCFIDQMPPGLRKSLYVKDEDIRLSLMNGNYVTMSSFRQQDLDQVAHLGLSPLYISVHTTDPALRCRMLGNRKAPDIMEQLDFLAENDIRFHTQIVVCPDYNDGKVLEKTVRDLLIFGDALQSVAVVPVGITRFQKNRLTPVDSSRARAICTAVGRISDRAVKRDGFRKVFLADELFIRAGGTIPGNEYYEEYPQIENGVGLIRQLLNSSSAAVKASLAGRRSARYKKPLKKLVLTSVSAAPFVRKVLAPVAEGETVDILSVVNTFFGETVTVAGLLTARDTIAAVKNTGRHYDEVVLPEVMFNYAGYTLDGYSAGRIARRIGTTVRVIKTIQEIQI